MNVSVVIPTRGDVDMQPVLDSFPPEWETVVYDNGAGRVEVITPGHSNGGRLTRAKDLLPDLSVYARYAAIEYASYELCFTQDDDVIVSDPQAIVDAWFDGYGFPCNGCSGFRSALCNDCEGAARDRTDHVVCNMPQEFRPHYPDSGLVGFGAAFHRDAPQRAFERFSWRSGVGNKTWVAGASGQLYPEIARFRRRADNVFTVLTPRVLVDVPKTDREMASDPNRMWKQPGHEGEKQRMIELARQVRDA